MRAPVRALALLCVLGAVSAGWAAEPTAVEIGKRIYLEGVLSSGAPLQGRHAVSTLRTQGQEAACVNCHQRSGLGMKEGAISIPPVAGAYLFAPASPDLGHGVLPYVETMHGNRTPYTQASIGQAIREGSDADGRILSDLMPRFALSDPDLSALIGYLRTLTVTASPGVVGGTVHFATVFTPDADPVKRRGVLDVLTHYVAEKNTFPLRPSPQMVTSGKTAYSKSMYMANRHWQLHVWDLSGPPESWRAQLERHLAEEPVFAVLSGVGGSNWAPVHQFCEEREVPCLFPNVEVPVVDPHGFYSLYFSKGVLLEAELIGRAIADDLPGDATGARGQAATLAGRTMGPIRTTALRGAAPTQVVQVYRAGDSGEAGARELAAQLRESGIAVRNRVIARRAHGGADVPKALQGLSRDAVLVLWLRPEDIRSLAGLKPPQTIYLSGLMGGLEDAPVPAEWRNHTLLAYPFDPPQRRGVRLDYPLGWFAFRHIPVVAQQVQADTYLACSLLAESVNHMSDTFVRAYLIERLQGMLEHRIVTGYYPHLALGPNQRFASKGGYLVQLPQHGLQLVARSDWVVP